MFIKLMFMGGANSLKIDINITKFPQIQISEEQGLSWFSIISNNTEPTQFGQVELANNRWSTIKISKIQYS